MLLSLNDQENVNHLQQTSKKQKSFHAPKTPGPPPKTPFGTKKIGLNDENHLGVITGKKGGKASVFADAFVTPMGPRNRAPLGQKDTNVKARNNNGFDTVKPQKTVQKTPTTRPSRSARLSISEVTKPLVQEDEYPEIEYMPPRPVDLPDLPDDYHPPNFSLIRENMYKDIFRDECTAFNERLDRQLASTEEEDRIIEESLLAGNNFGLGPTSNNVKRPLQAKSNAEINKKVVKKSEPKEKNLSKPKPLLAKRYDTATASSLKRRLPSRPNSASERRPASATEKRAAALLSQPSVSSSTTASIISKLKVSSSAIHKRSKSAVTRPTSIVHPKLAEVTSKTSIGYNMGRHVVKSHLADEDDFGLDFRAHGEEEEEDVDMVKQLQELYQPPVLFEEEDEDECFQIPMPKEDDE